MADDQPDPPALRAYHKCIEAMLADPDVHGDLFLIGLYLARRQYLGPRVSTTVSVGEMAALIFGTDATARTISFGGQRQVSSGHAYRYLEAIRKDMRRYDCMADPRNRRAEDGTYPSRRCGGPMVRREGVCGKPSTSTQWVTDPETGRRFALASCARHHAWEEEQAKASRAAVKALGEHVPTPPANTGGALRAHITGVDWPAYWRKIDPDWKMPPEDTPVVKPRLELFISHDFEPPVSMPTTRPALSLVVNAPDGAS